MTEPKKRGRRKTVQSRGLCQRTFKKKDGTVYTGDIWYMRYAAPDPDRPGEMKMVFESTGMTDKGDAYNELVKRKAAVVEQRHPELKRANEKTFKDFVTDDYLLYCKDQADINNKTNMCNNLLMPVFGRYQLKDITAKMVADYIKSKEAKSNRLYGDKTKGCEAGTLNRHLALIKHIFTVAGKAQYNLASQAKVFEIHSVGKRKEPPGRDGALTKKQFAELLKSAESIPFMHQFIRFSANTGLRRGRIFRLTWSMIVEDHNKQLYLAIPEDKHGGRHDAPLHPKAMEVIREREKVQQEDIPYVFYKESTRDRLADVKNEWKIITANAGLSWYHLHDLRHTFVSHAIMSGIDTQTTKLLSGHKTDIMVNRYAHLHPDHQNKAIKKFTLDLPIEEAPEADTALDSACL